MPKPVLETNEVYDFSKLPYPLTVGASGASSYNVFERHEHPEAGTLDYRNASLSFMHIAEMCWRTPTPVRLNNNIPMDCVNFVFQTGGMNYVKYNQLGKIFELSKGNHYFVHAPEDGFYNEMPAGGCAEVFHISLEKTLFAEMMKGDNFWTEKLLNNIEKKHSFSAPNLLQLTPTMWQLISDLKSYKVTGAVSHISMQALGLELIAAQMEQIQQAEQQSNEVLKADDVLKLRKLKEYLDEHYLAEMSLLQLSRISLLNEFKLKKGFKALYGNTVFGYIRELKMKHAAHLLAHHMPIIDVAFELGYEHPHHFSVAFKNYMGVNPSQFKK